MIFKYIVMQLELQLYDHIELDPNECYAISPTIGLLIFQASKSDQTLDTCRHCALQGHYSECAKIKYCVSPARKDSRHGYFIRSNK